MGQKVKIVFDLSHFIFTFFLLLIMKQMYPVSNVLANKNLQSANFNNSHLI